MSRAADGRSKGGTVMTRVSKAMPVGLSLAAMTVALSALLASGANATVPQATQLEGALVTEGFGPTTDGPYDLTFRLYAEAQGGTAVWSEGPVKVTVKKPGAPLGGIFAYAGCVIERKREEME